MLTIHQTPVKQPMTLAVQRFHRCLYCHKHITESVYVRIPAVRHGDDRRDLVTFYVFAHVFCVPETH